MVTTVPCALDHDPGVDQPDDRDEEADPDPDGELEVVGDGVDDRLAEADEHQHGDDQALGDDDAHSVGPAQAVGADEREGHEGVDAEAGRERERVAAVDPHREGGDRRDERGDGQQLVERELHAAGRGHRAQDLRVDEQDVGHRQERGRAAADLGRDARAARRDVEVAIEPCGERGAARGGVGSTGLHARHDAAPTGGLECARRVACRAWAGWSSVSCRARSSSRDRRERGLVAGFVSRSGGRARRCSGRPGGGRPLADVALEHAALLRAPRVPHHRRRAPHRARPLPPADAGPARACGPARGRARARGARAPRGDGGHARRDRPVGPRGGHRRLRPRLEAGGPARGRRPDGRRGRCRRHDPRGRRRAGQLRLEPPPARRRTRRAVVELQRAGVHRGPVPRAARPRRARGGLRRSDVRHGVGRRRAHGRVRAPGVLPAQGHLHPREPRGAGTAAARRLLRRAAAEDRRRDGVAAAPRGVRAQQ